MLLHLVLRTTRNCLGLTISLMAGVDNRVEPWFEDRGEEKEDGWKETIH